ncbi:CDT1-like protein b [Euphorbia lathyris]|uniref:CDT1-like protein b n=1 Tax=Euphorbia lathyris TaxID=212925 RepID=UPI00331378AC
MIFILLTEVEKGLDSAAEEHRMSQTNETHEHISVDLPGLVYLIHRIFQSISYHDFHFVDRDEVEEQIEVLEKLVPEWIFKNLALSGDALYSIKKMSDLNYVRFKIAAYKNTNTPTKTKRAKQAAVEGS